MCQAETAHALIFSLTLLFVGYAAFNGWLDAVVWILLFNITSIVPIKICPFVKTTAALLLVLGTIL